MPKLVAAVKRDGHTYIVRTANQPLRLMAAVVAVGRWAIDSRLNFQWADAAVIMAQLREQMQEKAG